MKPTRSPRAARPALRSSGSGVPPALAVLAALLLIPAHGPARARSDPPRSAATPALAAGARPDADAEVRSAVKAGDAAALRAALARGGHARQGGKFGVSLLMSAAEKGSAGVVAALLEAGADPRGTDSWGQSAIAYAVRGGNPEVVKELLAHGADVNDRSEHDFSPLVIAVGTGRLDLVRQLLAAGASPDQPVEGGATPLMLAAFHGHVDIAEALLAAGAKLDAEDEASRDALALAAAGGDPATIAFFERKTGRHAPERVIGQVGMAAKELREVDFRNFRYRVGERTIEVRDGASVPLAADDSGVGGGEAGPTIASVSATLNDLTGDGKPEAAVLLDVRPAEGGRRTPVIVYGLRDGRLAELGRLPESPEAAGRVTAIGIDRDELTVVRTAASGERASSRWRLTSAGLEPAPAPGR